MISKRNTHYGDIEANWAAVPFDHRKKFCLRRTRDKSQTDAACNVGKKVNVNVDAQAETGPPIRGETHTAHSAS